MAFRIRCPHLPGPPHPGSPLIRTCTNTRLSAGTSSGPARRWKASCESESSRLKRGWRSHDPGGAAGNEGAGSGKRVAQRREYGLPLRPSGKGINLLASFGKCMQWRIHTELPPLHCH